MGHRESQMGFETEKPVNSSGWKARRYWLARRGGRVVKLTGDGARIEFASAVEALAGAIEF
jgi:hypothetical protein